MDIVIAAAGKGTRLKSYTTDTPKHILPIAGRPFLYYLLDAINAAHFRRCIIVGGYHYDKLAAAINQYQAPEGDTELITLNQFEQLGDTAYGTACPLLAAKDRLQGDRFVYTMGDHLLSSEALERMQMSTSQMLLAAVEHTQPERFGVVETNGQHGLVRLVEKPAHPSSNLVNVGLYTLTPEIFPVLAKLNTSSRQEYEITDALNELAQQATIRVVPLVGPWLDLGRPEDIAGLEQFINQAQL